MNALMSALESSFERNAPDLLEIYRDLHRHPELSMQEHRTAGIAADYIEKLGYEVTRGVGVTGVVGLLRNGDGPKVMLRADMDALPMAEDTGLPFASTVSATDADGRQVSVAHSCGHDLHVAWLLGAARVLGIRDTDQAFDTVNRYRDLAISPDSLSFYVATDSSGFTRDAEGGATDELANPGSIIKFSYAARAQKSDSAER